MSFATKLPERGSVTPSGSCYSNHCDVCVPENWSSVTEMMTSTLQVSGNNFQMIQRILSELSKSVATSSRSLNSKERQLFYLVAGNIPTIKVDIIVIVK